MFKAPETTKAVRKESLSPCSYEPTDSFKKTQTRRLNGFISKYKTNNFVSETVKANAWKVSPAQGYDIDKGKHFVTKGLAKGWK